jgi:hypothetical protein
MPRKENGNNTNELASCIVANRWCCCNFREKTESRRGQGTINREIQFLKDWSEVVNPQVIS